MEVQVRYGYLDCYLFMSMCNSVGMYMNYICMYCVLQVLLVVDLIRYMQMIFFFIQGRCFE